jgi:hypothetical protein
VTVEELRWRRENDLSDRFRQSSCPPAPLGGKDPTLLLESRSNSIPFALMRAAGSSLSCSGGKREDQEERRDRDWWQLGGGCRRRDRRKIGTGGGWLGGKREERYWKLGQPVGAMDQQIAAHLTFYPSSLFFLFSSFYFLYTFIGCVLLS